MDQSALIGQRWWQTSGRLLAYDTHACLQSGMRFPRQPARSASRGGHALHVAASKPLIRGGGPHVNS